MKPLLFLFGCLFLSGQQLEGQPFDRAQAVYKTIDTTRLHLEIYYPETIDSNRLYPAMIFFFGGGWNTGKIIHFEHHARHFSGKGLICFLVDYRVKSRHGTTPFESLKDAKSAIRYIRSQAKQFRVDTGSIIAAGGSAGGHLAAATAVIDDFNEASDDLTVSCKPNALVLYNPVIDNGPGSYGFERIGVHYRDFSPLHNIRAGTPPVVFFLGTKDRLIPVETAQYFRTVMEKVGSRCDLHLFEDQDHGFFNYGNQQYYAETVRLTEEFLQSLGYLDERQD
jgi:acetyl esterase